jgi:hypothetical protein
MRRFDNGKGIRGSCFKPPRHPLLSRQSRPWFCLLAKYGWLAFEREQDVTHLRRQPHEQDHYFFLRHSQDVSDVRLVELQYEPQYGGFLPQRCKRGECRPDFVQGYCSVQAIFGQDFGPQPECSCVLRLCEFPGDAQEPRERVFVVGVGVQDPATSHLVGGAQQRSRENGVVRPEVQVQLDDARGEVVDVAEGGRSLLLPLILLCLEDFCDEATDLWAYGQLLDSCSNSLLGWGQCEGHGGTSYLASGRGRSERDYTNNTPFCQTVNIWRRAWVSVC